MNFENNSSWHYWGDNLGAAAADELVTQLFKSGRFSLVERSQLEAVLAEQELGQSGLVTSSQAAEIGRLLGVQLILTGSITKFSIGPFRAAPGHRVRQQGPAAPRRQGQTPARDRAVVVAVRSR